MSKEKKYTSIEGPRPRTKNWIILNELMRANYQNPKGTQVTPVPIQQLEAATGSDSKKVRSRIWTLRKDGNDIRSVRENGIDYYELYSLPDFTF